MSASIKISPILFFILLFIVVKFLAFLLFFSNLFVFHILALCIFGRLPEATVFYCAYSITSMSPSVNKTIDSTIYAHIFYEQNIDSSLNFEKKNMLSLFLKFTFNFDQIGKKERVNKQGHWRPLISRLKVSFGKCIN